MKALTLFAGSLACFMLVSCSSVHSVPPTDTKKPLPTAANKIKKKDPINVALYQPGTNPNTSYTIIGQTIVSRYNAAGVKRQEASIHDAMRSIAASLGGDAIIDVTPTHDEVIGKIITYRPRILA